MPFSYSDKETGTQTQGTLDEMKQQIDPSDLDLTDPMDYEVDEEEETFIFDNGTVTLTCTGKV